MHKGNVSEISYVQYRKSAGNCALSCSCKCAGHVQISCTFPSTGYSLEMSSVLQISGTYPTTGNATFFPVRGLPHTSNLLTLAIHTFRLEPANKTMYMNYVAVQLRRTTIPIYK